MALTLEQKELIVKLREEKQGYKSIASAVGCTRDQVRATCRSVGMLGYIKPECCIRKPRVCQWCGMDYERANGWTSTRYCSNECKREFSNNRARETREKKKAICKTCGKEFIRTTSTKYCSAECKCEKAICPICGKEFKRKIGEDKKTCSKKCGVEKIRMTHEEYYNKFSSVHKGMLVPLDVYDGCNEKMRAYCLTCKKITTRKAIDYTSSGKGRGCIHCGRKFSTGEDSVQEYLDNKNIGYIKQYQVEGLQDKRPLRFDFAVTDDCGNVMALIEYDGRQHFEPVKQFGGADEFKRQRKSDELKEEYANNNGIRLIRISYKEKHTIENVLGSI